MKLTPFFQAKPIASRYWIEGAIVVTQNAKREIVRRHLLVEDGIFSKISKTIPPKDKAKRIQAQDWVIVPGLVQAHLHLCQTLFRNMADDVDLLDWLGKYIWRFEAVHTAKSMHCSAYLGIAELLASGTTCILDMGSIRHTEVLFEAAKATGIRANIGKCLMDHPERNPSYLCEDTQAALKEATDLIQRFNQTENDRIRASLAPRFVLSCTDQLLSEVARLSKHHDAIIHTHTSENTREVAEVRRLTGKENIEFLKSLGLTTERSVLAHCVWLSQNEISILKASGSSVAHCPSSNLKLASGIAPIPRLLREKINVALGVDGAPCNNRLNGIDEMRLTALIHKPALGPTTLSAQEALDLATLGGAKALHWQDQIGSIEVGKKADFFAINMNSIQNFSSLASLKNPEKLGSEILSNLVYASTSNQIELTVVDGKEAYRKSSHPHSRAYKDLVETSRKEQSQLLLRAHKLKA